MKIETIFLSGSISCKGSYREALLLSYGEVKEITLPKLLLGKLTDDEFPLWLILFKNKRFPVTLNSSEQKHCNGDVSIIFNVTIKLDNLRNVVFNDSCGKDLFLVLSLIKKLFSEAGVCDVIKYKKGEITLSTEQCLFVLRKLTAIVGEMRFDGPFGFIRVEPQSLKVEIESRCVESKETLKNIEFSEFVEMIDECKDYFTF